MFEEHISMVIGPLYVIIGTVALFLMLRAGNMRRPARITVLIVSAILGFLAFTPMFPVQFQQLLLGRGPEDRPIIAAAAIILLLVLSTIAVGRIFCGYLCPIGAVQELMYFIPSKKLIGRYGRIFSIARSIVFVALIMSAVFGGIALLEWAGVTAFFHLRTRSPFFYIFAAILIVSLFLYRPFCRIACPLGLLMSWSSRLNFFKIRTGSACTNCTFCEKQCPTQTAILAPDRSGECYLCLRCADKCNQDAVVYRGRKD
ncbi:MAG: 4Fe-4S binding protein [Chitinispirillaceae bacterium]|nr:4Fe-4S binding protein [Chitinispirillaceae bacterium]